MSYTDKKNLEILDKLDRICAKNKPVNTTKAQITDALKELELPDIHYQNRMKYIFTGKNDTDAMTTLFVVATACKKIN